MTRARPTRLLRCSVNSAVVEIVTARLDAASRAADRLGNPKDSDALHDFRVGVRRLRGALRAYRPWLGKAASGKLRARLRALARSTNADRDTEVQSTWIRECRDQAPAVVHSELGRLLRRLRRHTRSRRKLVEEFAAIAAKLRARLQSIEPAGARFVEVYAPLVADHIEQAAACLSAVHRVDQTEEAHRARIAVKHLRYLLEPITVEIQDLSSCVDELAALQDLLGGLPDTQVFSGQRSREAREALGKAAFGFLETRNRERRDRLFERLRSQCLEGAAADLFAEIRRLVLGS